MTGNRSQDASPRLISTMRQAPGSMQAEQVVLGTVLAYEGAYYPAAEVLQESHFLLPEHQVIWRTIAQIREAGGRADAITVRARLEASGCLEGVGGAGYLAQLAGALMPAAVVRHYAMVVKDTWVARQVVELTCTAFETAHNPPDRGDTSPGRAAIEELEAGLLVLAESLEDEAPPVPLGEAVTTAIAKGKEALKRGTAFQGVSTGYAALDRMLCGMVPGDLVLLGARPSMGKTGLGLGVAIRAAITLRDDPKVAHKRVLFWSGEMAADQLGARAAAAHAGLSVASVFTHRQMALPQDRQDKRPPAPLTNDQGRALTAGEREAWRVPLVLDDRGGITVPRLRGRARRLRRDTKRGGLGLIVVDYVGLMRASEIGTRQGQVQAITEISNGLKAMARELAVPVLALAQLNRGLESREDKTPQMSDLRDSGALEQDADKILFLHRPHYYLSRAVPTQTAKETVEAFANRTSLWQEAVASSIGRADVLVAKNRQGPTGRTELRFCDHTVWFRDADEEDFAPAWPEDMTPAVSEQHPETGE